MRCLFSRALTFVSYWLGLDALFYWLNRRAKRIVCFHSVLPDGLKMPGLACGLDNTSKEFRMIVREIKKRFDISTDVLDPRAATLSFDDGFLNQYEVAARILAEEGSVPALLFVAGDMVGCEEAGQSIIVEQLLAWVSYVPSQFLSRLRDWPGGNCVDCSNRLRVWGEIVRPAFVQDVVSVGQSTLSKLDAIYPMAKIYATLPDEYLRLRMTGVNKSQMAELVRRGWIIGWHTKSHFPLKSLSIEKQKSELEPTEYVSREVMAYPYGDRQSVGGEAIEIVKGYGYKCALSFDSCPGEWLNRYYLPRMFLKPDKYAVHFELSGFKYFLRYHRLLPVWL